MSKTLQRTSLKAPKRKFSDKWSPSAARVTAKSSECAWFSIKSANAWEWSKIQHIRLTWPLSRVQMAAMQSWIYSLGAFAKSIGVFWTYSDLPVIISDNFIFSSFEQIFQHFSRIRRLGSESYSFVWLGHHQDCTWWPFIAAFTL